MKFKDNNFFLVIDFSNQFNLFDTGDTVGPDRSYKYRSSSATSLEI